MRVLYPWACMKGRVKGSLLANRYTWGGIAIPLQKKAHLSHHQNIKLVLYARRVAESVVFLPPYGQRQRGRGGLARHRAGISISIDRSSRGKSRRTRQSEICGQSHRWRLEPLALRSHRGLGSSGL